MADVSVCTLETVDIEFASFLFQVFCTLTAPLYIAIRLFGPPWLVSSL
jgi:hypothetical protein